MAATIRSCRRASAASSTSARPRRSGSAHRGRHPHDDELARRRAVPRRVARVLRPGLASAPSRARAGAREIAQRTASRPTSTGLLRSLVRAVSSMRMATTLRRMERSMGLLDQILGGLGGAVGRSQTGRSGAGSGMGRVLMSLLPVVLGMLANRSSRAASRPEAVRPGAWPLRSTRTAAGGFGGLGGLLEQLTQGGYGRQAQSWVSTGDNEPIDPDALSQVFGNDRIAQIAARAGVSEQEARGGLAELLPNVVDHFTPDGETAPDGSAGGEHRRLSAATRPVAVRRTGNSDVDRSAGQARVRSGTKVELSVASGRSASAGLASSGNSRPAAPPIRSPRASAARRRASRT